MSDELIAALLKERFGAVSARTETTRGPLPYPQHGDGGPDNELTCARRRRELLDACDQPRKRAAA